jgi:4-hydroxybutyrate CoA-transferase
MGRLRAPSADPRARRRPGGQDYRGRDESTPLPSGPPMTTADERMAADPRRSLFLPFLAPSRGERAGSWVSAEEAIAAIPDGSHVFVSGGAGTPMGLMEALAAGRGRFTDLELVFPFLMARPAPFEHPGEPFRYVTTQASPAFKYLWDTGTVRILPARYSDYRGIFGPNGPRPVDVAIVEVSPPGPEGRVSMGLSAGGNIDVARTAGLVIAQVNESMPYTFGASEMETTEFDFLVELHEPVLEARPADTSNDTAARAIARASVEFIDDGCTIQFGIGAIPDAILADLSDRRGLRVHSGMVSDACADLIEAGAVDGPMIAAEVSSTPRMIEWVHRNENLLMAPAAYSHGPVALAQQPKLRTLNSTLEVALDGSMNSATSGGRIISGPGGAPDFAMAGSALTSDARSIIGLKSTAGRGTISRIVPRIEPPNTVMLPAWLADIVVTEHGVAELRGLTDPERAEALIAIASPEHREQLEAFLA